VTLLNTMLLVLLTGCTHGSFGGPGGPEAGRPAGTSPTETTSGLATADSGDPGSTASVSADGGADGGGTDGGGADGGGTDTAEQVPGLDDASDLIFVQDQVHDLTLHLDDTSWRNLTAHGRTWVQADLVYKDRSWMVGLRLKGNTSYDDLGGKPALKVDVNRYVDGQDFYGMPGFYLQNMRWDPSSMHEFLGYGFFVSVSVPAARAAYAHLTINDQDYGLYLILEKQNGPFMRRWFDDDSGSIYEAGSFNYGCDLDDGPATNPCDCFELDHLGDADSRADLAGLCRTATNLDGGWYAAMDTVLDMNLFVHAMAAEMVVSHYDNYGWNINNYRIAHIPTTGRWVFTPWSVDLAFGWYPWMADPHCGTYGVSPTEYDGGYLVRRCWRDATCTAKLKRALVDQADAFDDADMVSKINAARALISPLVDADTRRIYSTAVFEREVDCMRSFSEGRGDVIRTWVREHP